MFTRFVKDLMIYLQADLIISITIPNGPTALAFLTFAIALEIISFVMQRGGPIFGSRSRRESLFHTSSTFSCLSKWLFQAFNLAESLYVTQP